MITRLPSADFHVVIVGAGLGGAACAIACARQGLRVTLFDAVPKFFPLGDSVGFGSNTTKLFKRWGMYDDMWAISSRAEESVMRNWDGAVITVDSTLGQAEERYGHKALIGHRGQYHEIFINHCRKNGVDVRMGVKIEKYDVAKPSVFLPTGEEILADAVIAADGVKSHGRTQVLGIEDAPIHSGYAVWRAYSDSAIFKDDPLVSPLLDKDTTQLWIGPDLHGFVTTIRDGTGINAVLTHKDVADISEGWNLPAERQDILDAVKGWDPVFVRVWEKIQNIIDWKLVYRPCLDQWVNSTGLVAIMGDARGPFLPTSTQGASQAVEDGATVALCLARAGKGNVPLALRTYFELRYEHVKGAQAIGISQRTKWHSLHNKTSMKMEKELDTSKGILDSYSLWTHDAEKAVEDGWNEASAKVRREMQGSNQTV
ncbi:6-hydroxynicotinate 3-monooxygenase [Cyphellophora attinorum]|uniref:6-hydroxynicotinate 3-monooxygenase n=1 Tax=Cyphellophora attinorum TaxID=1664694 RepID=A0A0N1HWP7_9EURO|nr:6-hydroxynicotinate 3-monooxygenase [Phialophora attinorum]KPI42132.1 6-hydroxynicotinate 3-monooxygenase [Phialophora attinorum]